MKPESTDQDTCQTCVCYTPRNSGRFGGECTEPHSPAAYWNDADIKWTTPNATCPLHIRKEEVA